VLVVKYVAIVRSVKKFHYSHGSIVCFPI